MDHVLALKATGHPRSCWNQTCKQQNWISGLQASVYYNWLQAKHLFLQAAVNSRALSFLLETGVQLYIWTPHHQYMNEHCNISHMLSPEKTDTMSFTCLIYKERLTWWLWLVCKPWNHVEGRHACNVFWMWLTVSEMGKCKCRALKDIAKLRGTSDLHKLAAVHGCKHKLPPGLQSLSHLPLTVKDWVSSNARRADMRDKLPNSLCDLLEKCLQVDPNNRIDATQALCHEFFSPCHLSSYQHDICQSLSNKCS
jgi:serine/threonine protein kinase